MRHFFRNHRILKIWSFRTRTFCSTMSWLWSSDVTIRLYRFRFDFSINNSISIRLGFEFFTICTPLLTQLDSCVAAWERQCCGAGHPWSYPPTAAVVVGLNREDVEWAKYRSNSVALWHGAEAAKLDSATIHTNSIHCLMFSLVPCGRCLLSDMRTSPTLVNRPTCLHAYNTRGCR